MAKTKHPKDKSATTRQPTTSMPVETQESLRPESMTPSRDAPHAAPSMEQRPDEARERRTSVKDKQRNQPRR
jgi:hypothetical protein